MVTEAIKQGYKQTEVGVIPEDWDVQIIEELLKNNIITYHLDGNHGELYPRSNEFSYEGVPYIAANDFRTGIVDFNQCKKLPAERAKKFKKGIAINGDVLFAHNATVGPVALLETKLDYVILSTTATDFRCDNKHLLNLFLRYFFESQFFVRQYSAVMSQSTRNQVPITTQRKFLILLPSFAEQSHIASVLSDTDKLIESLDKLIVKKKNIKQGAMQRLLTGKKRLSGFKCEWKNELFGSLVEINKGQQINKSELTETGDYPDWNGGIIPSGYTHKWNMVENTITISEGGNSCGFVNYCRQKFWLGGHCYALKINGDSLDKLFLYQLLKFRENAIMNLRIGSGLPNIQKKNIREFILFIPKDLEEQRAISQVLSDMDAEIEYLEQKRDKVKLLKIGMMQQLLTGRIRLI